MIMKQNGKNRPGGRFFLTLNYFVFFLKIYKNVLFLLRNCDKIYMNKSRLTKIIQITQVILENPEKFV